MWRPAGQLLQPHIGFLGAATAPAITLFTPCLAGGLNASISTQTPSTATPPTNEHAWSHSTSKISAHFNFCFAHCSSHYPASYHTTTSQADSDANPNGDYNANPCADPNLNPNASSTARAATRTAPDPAASSLRGYATDSLSSTAANSASALGATSPASNTVESATSPSTIASPPTSKANSAHTSSSASTIQDIRARVFGHHQGNNLRSGRKVLAKALKGPVISDWYFTPKTVPGIHNAEQEYKEYKQELVPGKKKSKK